MNKKELVSALREMMKQNNVDAVYITGTDPHGSDGVATHWRVMQWFSGFSGTTGCCVVTMDKAAFWSDGRYVAQMVRELDQDVFECINTSDPTSLSWTEWVGKNVKDGGVLAMDGEVLSYADFKKLENAFSQYNISIRHDMNLPGELWEDRPAIPDAPIWELELKYAGKSREDKLAQVREKMSEKGATHYLGCSLDDMAWLTNLRGGDHPLYPIFHGYVIITPDKACVCVDVEKIPADLQEKLNNAGFSLYPRSAAPELLAQIPAGSKILVDPYKATLQLYAAIPTGVQKLEQMDLVAFIKNHKNPVEQENIRKSNIKEGVAVCRYIRHIYDRLAKGPVTEMDLVHDLEIFRKMDPEYVQPANLGIIAYGENAALPHYRPTEEVFSELKPEGMLLFDICAHYLTGTTDITRVIPLGPVTEEMREDYTLALKSNITLTNQTFVYGMTGDILDGISKQVQWNNLRHFGHGTGHGMGYLLYVHEGPRKIITEYAPLFPYGKTTPLDVGCLFSNEPGVYKPGRHGIRLETNMLVQEECVNEFGRFLKFETVTFIPYDRSLIVKELLTPFELDWLNKYHAETYEKLSPYLNEEECAWLKEATMPL